VLYLSLFPAVLLEALLGGPAAVVLVPHLLALTLAGVLANLFVCPRCGQRFTGRRWWTARWTRRACAHCRLAVGTPNALFR
jgi:hypothetical protein